MAMEKKIMPLIVLDSDDPATANDQGIVETVFAVFGNIDEGDDIMHIGSFTKTFRERGVKVRILDQHNTDSIMRALGTPVELKELSRAELPQQVLDAYPDAAGGAYAKIQFLMNTPEGAGKLLAAPKLRNNEKKARGSPKNRKTVRINRREKGIVCT